MKKFFNEKYFKDTENKMKNKIKTIYFRNNPMIKKQIIFIKKFGIFWKAFIQYCIPIINTRKYRFEEEMRKEKQESINMDDEPRNKKKASSLPKINYRKKKYSLFL